MRSTATALLLAWASWLGACSAIAQEQALPTGSERAVSGLGQDHRPLAPAAGELRITVQGMRSSIGTVLIGLYDSAESFNRAIDLSDKEGFLNDLSRVAGVALKASDAKTAGVVFGNLPPGQYGVIVFQDENGNGRLDKTVWGVPTEPYGFSNNAQGSLGPPSFADVAMTLSGGNEAIDIALVYHAGSVGDASGSASATGP